MRAAMGGVGLSLPRQSSDLPAAAGVRRNRSTIAGSGMGGVALDGGVELGGHGRDDALAHAGRARIGLDLVADAVVGDRQQQILALRGQLDMDRAGAVGIGVFHRVHHQFVDDDADGDGAVRIDLDRLGLQRQARHPVAFGRAAEILEQRVQILVEHARSSGPARCRGGGAPARPRRRGPSRWSAPP